MPTNMNNEIYRENLERNRYERNNTPTDPSRSYNLTVRLNIKLFREFWYTFEIVFVFPSV